MLQNNLRVLPTSHDITPSPQVQRRMERRNILLSKTIDRYHRFESEGIKARPAIQERIATVSDYTYYPSHSSGHFQPNFREIKRATPTKAGRNERDACEGGFQNSPTLQFASRGDSLQCHKIGAAQRIRRGCANTQTSNASLSPKSVASFFLASGRYCQARRRASRPETLGGTGATRAGQRTCHATHWKSQRERSCLAENTPLHTLCTSTEAKY